MATVVLNVRQITQIQQMVPPVAAVHAINHVPRHVHDRHAHLMRPVPMAVQQPAENTITVVRAMHRHQHAQSAYLVNQDIIKAAAAAHLVQLSVRRTYHNHVHAIQPARN